MSAPSPQTVEHDHEHGAQPRRAEHEPVAPARVGNDVVRLLSALQRSAGNQAVNQLVRRHTVRRVSSIQRDEDSALPAPTFQLNPPSMLQPGTSGPAPWPEYQLHLDPQIQA